MTPKLKQILELAKGSERNLLQEALLEAGINADDVAIDNSELPCSERIQVDPSVARVSSVDAPLGVPIIQDVLIPSVSALMLADISVCTSPILDTVTAEEGSHVAPVMLASVNDIAIKEVESPLTATVAETQDTPVPLVVSPSSTPDKLAQEKFKPSLAPSAPATNTLSTKTTIPSASCSTSSPCIYKTVMNDLVLSSPSTQSSPVSMPDPSEWGEVALTTPATPATMSPSPVVLPSRNVSPSPGLSNLRDTVSMVVQDSSPIKVDCVPGSTDLFTPRMTLEDSQDASINQALAEMLAIPSEHSPLKTPVKHKIKKPKRHHRHKETKREVASSPNKLTNGIVSEKMKLKRKSSVAEGCEPPLKKKTQEKELQPDNEPAAIGPVLMEHDFVPHYEEAAMNSSPMTLIHKTMRELSKSVVEQVNENPHVVAGAITGLSRQLILSHHGYQDLTSKLSQYIEQTDPKKLPRHHDEEMKVLRGIKSELQSLNHSSVNQSRQLAQVLHSIEKMTTSMSGLASRLEVSFTGLTTALQAICNSSIAVNSTAAVPDSPKVDREESNRDCEQEWLQQQQNTNRHLEMRRSEYPYSYTPLDRNNNRDGHRRDMDHENHHQDRRRVLSVIQYNDRRRQESSRDRRDHR